MEEKSRRRLSPRVQIQTLYNHKKHGSQVPQALPTRRILVEPAKKPTTEPGKYLPRNVSRSDHYLPPSDPPPVRPPRKKFVPIIPTLSPNSFTQAWRKETKGREDVLSQLGAGEGPNVQHWDMRKWIRFRELEFTRLRPSYLYSLFCKFSVWQNDKKEKEEKMLTPPPPPPPPVPARQQKHASKDFMFSSSSSIDFYCP